MSNYVLYFDGACEPINPGGIASYGYVLYRGQETVTQESGMAAEPGSDEATNNVAEYLAMIRGIEKALELLSPGESLLVRGDSMLAINQVQGIYRIKSPRIAPYAYHAIDLIKRVREKGISIQLEWVPRDQNSEADRLSKAILVEKVKNDPKSILDLRLKWGKFNKERLRDVPYSYYRWVWNREPGMAPDFPDGEPEADDV